MHPQRHWFTHIQFDWWGNGGQIALSVLMDGVIWLLCWSCVPKSWPYLLSLPLICLSLFCCHSLNLKLVRACISTHQLLRLQFISIWGALGMTIHWDLHSFPQTHCSFLLNTLHFSPVIPTVPCVCVCVLQTVIWIFIVPRDKVCVQCMIPIPKCFD